jgi:hypothetical protein
MITIYLRFYEELNEFLPKIQRKVEFAKELLLPTTVKDLIESCRVPHTEVDLILVNGQSVDFDHKVNDEDKISIYPMFESIDVSPLTHLQDRPLRNLKFFVDAPLGKLARLMRLLGLDVHYDRKITGIEFLETTLKKKRILLTRNRQLLMPNKVTHGYCIHSNDPYQQIKEVVRRFDLTRQLKPFTRCSICNSILKKVAKKEIINLLEPLTKKYYDNFIHCPECGKIYWRGSHFSALQRFVTSFDNTK